MSPEFSQPEVGEPIPPETSFISNLRHWLGHQITRFVSSESFIEAGVAIGSTTAAGIMAQAEIRRAKAAAESSSAGGKVISIAERGRLRRLAQADGLQAQRKQSGQRPINAYRPWDDIDTDKGDGVL